MEFKGYRRDNGRVGTRNYIGVISTVVCANEVAEKISSQVLGTVPFLHQQGCCQTPLDIHRVTNVLIGLGRNPKPCLCTFSEPGLRKRRQLGGCRKRDFPNREKRGNCYDPRGRGLRKSCRRGSAPRSGDGQRRLPIGKNRVPCRGSRSRVEMWQFGHDVGPFFKSCFRNCIRSP